MFAVRQLQIAAPSLETVSMPPNGLSVYPDRRIRSLSKTPFLFGNFAARLSGSASALHRTASQLPSIPVFRNIIPCLYAGGT
jgi:hypothetical protein